jgi:hypothetical protein
MYLMKNYILRLDVPVNDVMLMQVLNRVTHLPDNAFHLLLSESSFFSKHCVNIARVAQLDHQVYEIILLKVCVQLANVWVVQE